MSYNSSINNKVLYNIFYNNNECSNDLSGNNFSSISYVQNNISNINLTNEINDLTQLQNELNDILPKLDLLIEKNKRVIGSITTTVLLTPPPNYLLCDGSLISVSSYQQLFNILGYKYGGSGASFNLPNFKNYYILGGNNNINNIAVSNLFSGNGTAGATNDYKSSFNVFNGTPLLTVVPEHNHQLIDNGHFHSNDTNTQPFSDVGVTQFIKEANQDGNVNSKIAFTGITLTDQGDGIQTTDFKSGLAGVNLSAPFFSCTFIICYQ
jgi:microcystin-dependent protein